MEFNESPENKLIDGLTDEEIEFLTSRHEKVWDDIISIKIYSAEIEALKEMNPAFQNKTMKQLNEDENFQRALFEYRAKYPTPTIIIEPEKIKEVLKSFVPLKHIKPVNKLANTITHDIIDIGEIELIISNKKDVSTKVMLAFDSNHIQLSGHEKYTPYDREVYDGVVTLYEAGNSIITPPMVYRAMNGLSETEYVSSQSVTAVTKSLDKSRFIRTTIDYTEEAKLYNKNIQKSHYDGYLLAATKITVKVSGNEQEAYKLISKPILYEYAQISGQIITVPAKLLQTKDALRSTDEVIVIRGFLLRQIEWIKNEKATRSANITYKSIYEELEITKDIYKADMYKKKTHATRVHVKTILEEWKRQGYLKDYEEYKERKTLKGVYIKI